MDFKIPCSFQTNDFINELNSELQADAKLQTQKCKELVEICSELSGRKAEIFTFLDQKSN